MTTKNSKIKIKLRKKASVGEDKAGVKDAKAGVKDSKAASNKFLKSTLYPHQKDFLRKALKWETIGKHGGLLGAEMGTGKTLMMLSLFASNLDPVTKEPRKTIVIAPLSLLNNWKNEYKKHLKLPIGKLAIYHGKSRHLIPLENKLFIITTYDTVRQDCKKGSYDSSLLQCVAERIILDEAHEIKNQKSQRFQTCLMLSNLENDKINLNWAMTGTPIQNYKNDLISLAKFINFELFNESEWWNKASSEDIEEWKESFYIYFSKEGAGLSLPQKHFYTHELEFSEKESKTYQNMKTEAKEFFEDFLKDHTKNRFACLLTKILRLRQFCNHPQTINSPGTDWSEKETRHELNHSTKTIEIIRILNNIPQNEKIVIFSQFTNSLKILNILLEKAGYQCLMYNGSMNHIDKEQTLVNFENKDNKRILLMSLKAGGVGLNLIRGNHIILLDTWWNLSVEEQALARVHRIGQTKEVHVHRIRIKNTIENWVTSLQEYKQQEINEILCGDELILEGTTAKNFTKDDLYKLFREVCN